MAKKKVVPKKSTKKKAAKKPEKAKKPEEKAPEPTKDLRHYEEIVKLNTEVRAAFDRYDVARLEAKMLKETYDVKCSALTSLINEGPDPQLPLPFGGDDKELGDQTPKAAEKPQAA